MTSKTGLRIITNHHHRDIVDAWQLTAEERARFDYLDWDAIERGEDSASFFRYRGELHDLGEFTTTAPGPFNHGLSDAMRRWDGYRSDSFFSALVVRYVDNYEGVVVGLALS